MSPLLSVLAFPRAVFAVVAGVSKERAAALRKG